MIHILRLPILISIFLYSTTLYSYEVVEICARYENTNKSYKVEGKIFKGSELNERTNSYEYTSFSHYVVIFWDDDQATVIELDYYFGNLSFIGISGKDQQGYPWEISKAGSFCY